MSELEIIDRAEIEDQNRSALSAAQYLFGYATVAVVYFYLAFIIGALFEPGIAFGQIFVSFIALILFWWRYIAWGRRYFQNSLSDETFAEALDTRRRTLMIGVALSVLVLGVTYWTIS